MKSLVLALSTIFFFLTSQAQEKDLNQFVNPFIGTGGHGHTYPGATTPFGFVQLSPDSKTTGWDWCSGYHYSDTTIMGFSHTHLSGTGAGDLGDVLLMPYYGKIEIFPGAPDKPGEGYHSGFSHQQENAEPGYYSVYLKKHGIKAELTATTNVGFHKYTFPKASDETRIILDLAHGIHSNIPFATEINIENDSTVSGYRYSTGWAMDKRLYFVIQFSKPFAQTGISLYDGPLRLIPIAKSNKLKAVFTFKVAEKEAVLVKVGLSANSKENARKNLGQVKDWNFEKVRENAKNTWNGLLSSVQIEGDAKKKEIFYTALYHNLVVPNIISDEDSTFYGPDLEYHKSKTGKYYSTFSLWDTFRASHPLYTMLYPQQVGEFVNSFIQHHKIYGYLPIWPLWGTETHTMIANNAIPVIAEAVMKGVKGFDVEEAYRAVKETSTKSHYNSFYNIVEKHGYLPHDVTTQSVARTLEGAYNDWCVAQMAKYLGKEEDYKFFSWRAGFYKNVFDPSTGFMRGKNSKGEWTKNFNPLWTSYSGDYTEANAWQYSWSVLHDIDGLINLHGSKEKFAQKLDSLFKQESKLVGEVSDVTGLIGQYAHGNEPSHHVAYLYNYAGQPWKTQFYVNKILNEMYQATPDGLSGNEDCGQMSAWFIFSSIGFYPVNPASGEYSLGTPSFEKVTLNLPNDKQFQVIAHNLSKKNIYVKKVKLNGKDYNKLSITHDDISKGGKLEFFMTEKRRII